MNDNQEVLEVEDFNNEIQVRMTQIRKRSTYIFVSVFLVFLTRFFAKHADFNIVLNSTILVGLFAATFFVAIISRIFVSNVKVFAKDKKTNMNLKRFNDTLDFVMIIPIFIAIVTILNVSLLSISNVEGSSMEPNFQDQDDIVIYHPFWIDYERFDVVIVKVNNGDYYIKRIIGMPGETVRIDNNKILINGTELDQSMIDFEEDEYTYCRISFGDNCEFVVPEGSYFVLGDNRDSSNDSRSDLVGSIKQEDMFGKVIFKYRNLFRTQE